MINDHLLMKTMNAKARNYGNTKGARKKGLPLGKLHGAQFSGSLITYHYLFLNPEPWF
jgi:hypothetical protein